MRSSTLVTTTAAALGVGGLAMLLRAIRKRAINAGRNVLDLQTPVPSDIDIAQSVVLTPIRELWNRAFGLLEDELFAHGTYKAKLEAGLL